MVSECCISSTINQYYVFWVGFFLARAYTLCVGNDLENSTALIETSVLLLYTYLSITIKYTTDMYAFITREGVFFTIFAIFVEARIQNPANITTSCHVLVLYYSQYLKREMKNT